jgi:glycosyltransferase involved in cell wall biosynthesis
MRIVYLLASLGVGGAERQALLIAERMRERGHSVAVFTMRSRLDEEWPTSLPVFRLDMRKTPFSFLAALVRARRYLRDLDPDLIHSHSFHANIFARLLKLFVPDAAIVSNIHNVYEGGRSRMWLYRATDRLSARTVAVSQAVAERFIRSRAVPAGKCSVILNGIDLAAFFPDAVRRNRTRTAYEAGADFIWLAVGRLAPAKDYPSLLRAFAQVLRSINAAQLWIAGEGSAAEASALKALAVKLNIADSVRWLGLRRDIPALLDAADGFVLSSAWEGLPLALGDAMAMKKTVVATDVGGVRELVGDAGVVVPAGRVQKLTEAMLARICQSAGARQSTGSAARERILEYFAVDSRAEEWDLLYSKLLNAPSQ